MRWLCISPHGNTFTQIHLTDDWFDISEVKWCCRHAVAVPDRNKFLTVVRICTMNRLKSTAGQDVIGQIKSAMYNA